VVRSLSSTSIRLVVFPLPLIKADRIGSGDVKVRARILRGFLDNIASRERIELRLRKKERADGGK